VVSVVSVVSGVNVVNGIGGVGVVSPELGAKTLDSTIDYITAGSFKVKKRRRERVSVGLATSEVGPAT
jgi:hypothetical protein